MVATLAHFGVALKARRQHEVLASTKSTRGHLEMTFQVLIKLCPQAHRTQATARAQSQIYRSLPFLVSPASLKKVPQRRA